MAIRYLNGAPDPKSFPDPHQFATYMTWRNPAFKTHPSLATAKNAVSGKARGLTGRGRHVGCDVYVYEFSQDTGWQLLHLIPKETNLDDHEFYKTTAKKRSIKGPSDAAVAAAIKSITGS